MSTNSSVQPTQAISTNSNVALNPACSGAWFIVLPLSTSDVVWYSLLAVIHLFLQLTATVLNSLVIKAIAALRTKNRTRPHTITLNLCITDLVYSMTTELVYIALLLLQLSTTTIDCSLVLFIGVTGLYLCFASFLFMVFATVERYVAIFRPFDYVSYFTTKLMSICVIFTYLIAGALTAMFHLTSFGFAAGITVLSLLCGGGIIMTVAFVRIFAFVFRLQKELKQQHTDRGHINNVKEDDGDTGGTRARRATQRKNHGYARLLAFLLLSMCACYIPYLAAMCVHVFAKSVSVPKSLLHWLWALLLVNSTLNPICFCFFDKEIRHEVKQTLKSKNRIEDITASQFNVSRTDNVNSLVGIGQKCKVPISLGQPGQVRIGTENDITGRSRDHKDGAHPRPTLMGNAEATSSLAKKVPLSTHHKGFIRRKRSPIKKPMVLTRDKQLRKEAVDIFKLSLHYMGDKSSRKSSATLALEIVSKGWSMPGLRDEIYIQLCKQTTANERSTSLEKGWELITVCLAMFPPSNKFHSYLEGYIYRHLEPEHDELGVPVSKYAKHCYKQLERICRSGAKRGLKKPTIDEIEQAKESVFHPSLFGNTLEEIMEMQQEHYPDRMLPWIMTTLADFVLSHNGLRTEGIFRVPGDIDEVNSLKVQIDKWKEPTTGFMSPEVSSISKMGEDNLAMVWAPNCLRCPSEDHLQIFENTRKEMTFLRTLMQNLNTSFLEDVL
eukprot:gene17061-18779_t